MAQRQPNFPLKINVPGAFGVTGESSISGEVPEWLLVADNAIFSREGLIAPRALWREIPTIGSIAPFTTSLSETYQFLSTAGYVFVWSQLGEELMGSYGGTPIDITALPDDGNPPPTFGVRSAISVAYLQKKFYFADSTAEMQVYDPVAATFSKVASPVTFTVLDGLSIIHSAFGRLWGCKANSTVLYWSVLLDGGDWAGVGSGSLDLASYLSNGEYITAIADFNNYLIVFTSKSTLIFQDPFTVPIDSSGTAGTETTMSLKEQINGTGCIGKNAWANVGEEIYFVDRSGLRRLSRVIQEGGSNPIDSVCAHINPFLKLPVAGTNIDSVYLHYLPTLKALAMDISGITTYMIWLDRPIGEGAFAVTHWGSYGTDVTSATTTAPPYKFITAVQEFQFFGSSYPIVVCWYREYDELSQIQYNNMAYMPLYDTVDPADGAMAETEYTFRIQSAWLNFGNGQDAVTKIMKDLKLIYRTPTAPYAVGSVYTSTALDITYKLRFDYGTTEAVHTFTTPLSQRGDMVSPYHVMGYHTVTPLSLSGNGSSIQWEIEATIDNKAHEYFAVQQAGFSVKLGRIHQGI